jgi:hypothetical protein
MRNSNVGYPDAYLVVWRPVPSVGRQRQVKYLTYRSTVGNKLIGKIMDYNEDGRPRQTSRAGVTTVALRRQGWCRGVAGTVTVKSIEIGLQNSCFRPPHHLPKVGT